MHDHHSEPVSLWQGRHRTCVLPGEADDWRTGRFTRQSLLRPHMREAFILSKPCLSGTLP